MAGMRHGGGTRKRGLNRASRGRRNRADTTNAGLQTRWYGSTVVEADRWHPSSRPARPVVGQSQASPWPSGPSTANAAAWSSIGTSTPRSTSPGSTRPVWVNGVPPGVARWQDVEPPASPDPRKSGDGRRPRSVNPAQPTRWQDEDCRLARGGCLMRHTLIGQVTVATLTVTGSWSRPEGVWRARRARGASAWICRWRRRAAGAALARKARWRQPG